MIVVAIIGVLAALGTPAYQKLVAKSKQTMFASDLRAATHAIDRFAMEQGSWPPDGAGSWPEALREYLPPPERWHKPTPVGGTWSWSVGAGDYRVALLVSDLPGGVAQAALLDRLVDDGDLTQGLVRAAGTGLAYVFEE